MPSKESIDISPAVVLLFSHSNAPRPFFHHLSFSSVRIVFSCKSNIAVDIACRYGEPKGNKNSI